MGSYVGQRMPRYDSLGHVTGKTQFVDDITLPGMLTIKVRRSPVARAKILNIDTTEAKKCPGVYAVATAKDVPHNLCGFYGDHPVLAENEIRFRGQVIAAVAAIDEDAAMEALSKVKIDLEELTPIFDPREAMKPDSEQIRPEGNLWEFEPGMRVRQLRKGDIEKGFAQADVIVEGDYSTCVGEHAMLAPCCSIGDIDERGRLVIYTASQAPSLHATMIAGTLGLPLNKLNMVGGTVGGGFGGRNDPVADHLVGLLAMMTQKPCKWRWTREEEMVCSQMRGAWQFHIKDGVTKDGKIVARQIEEIHDTGAYGGFGPYAVDKSVFTITGPYDVPNVHINGYCVFTNKQVATSMRGFGINIGQFAMEAHMDKIAETLNMSPWELRFKNAWKEGTLSSTQQEMHAVGLIETLQATAKLAGEKLSPELLAMSSK